MKKIIVHLTCLFIGWFMTETVIASVLWTNGDPKWGGTSNEINTGVSHSQIYEDFIIPNGETWQIEKLWSNNTFSLSSSTISTAQWEIRNNISEGNGGNLLISGLASADLTLMGTSIYNPNIPIWNVAVSTNFTLTSGVYWLSVAPVGTGSSGQSWAAQTDGTNGVGQVLNKTAYWYSEFWRRNFEYANPGNYSFGIEGTITTQSTIPEPTTIILFGFGLLGLAGMSRKKGNRDKSIATL